MEENKAYPEQEETTFPQEEVSSDVDDRSEASAVDAEAEFSISETEDAEESQECSVQPTIPQSDSTSKPFGSDADSDIEVISEDPISLPDLIPFRNVKYSDHFPIRYANEFIGEFSELQEIHYVLTERTSPNESESSSPKSSEDDNLLPGEIFAMSLESSLESIHDSNERASNFVKPDIVMDSLKNISTEENAHKNDLLDYLRRERKSGGNSDVAQKGTDSNDVIIEEISGKITAEAVERNLAERGYCKANELEYFEGEYEEADAPPILFSVSPEETNSAIVSEITRETDNLEELENIRGENRTLSQEVLTGPSEGIGGCTEKNIAEAVEDEVFVSNTSSIPDTAKLLVKDALLRNDGSNNPGSSKALTEAECHLTRPRDRRYSDTSIEEAQEAFEALNPEIFGKIGDWCADYAEKSYECKQIETSSSSSDFVEVSFDVKISKAHIAQVLRRMSNNHYMADGNEEDLEMYSYCKYLFEKDYKIKVINNEGGTLSKHYPTQIIVPFADKDSTISYDFDPVVYKELTMQSSAARCRNRFVAPTIYYDGKYICRSATLTVRKSAVYETATKSPPPKEVEVDPGPAERVLRHVRAGSGKLAHRTLNTAEAVSKLMDPESMLKQREQDKKLLEYCNVLYISDLMIEFGKVKFGISVSASEKMYQETYAKFEILQMPYPGCKFFRRYHKAGRIPDALIFDWKRSDVNADLLIPPAPRIIVPPKDWSLYKEWDVVELTQNYMELVLNYFIQGEKGILIHCISGWDRTPLFIALLRISLWADGLIHKSLNPLEMAYLTLAYDWYLFGHDLPGRLKKEEEIMHFCYKFLEYFCNDYFSVTLTWNNAYLETTRQDHHEVTFMPFIPGSRGEKIKELKDIVLELYDEHVIKSSQ